MKNWRVKEPNTFDCEFGFSCMGYEIAAGWGAAMADPTRTPIVMIGDRAAMNPIVNSAAMWGTGLVGSVIFAIDFFANFFQYHLMGVQAYHLDVDPDPGVVPWLGTRRGTVHTGYGELTIQELLKTASDDGILIAP